MLRPFNKHDGTDVIVFIPGKGAAICHGDPPPAGAAGYIPGCLFFNQQGNSLATYWHVNKGSVASCNFNAINIDGSGQQAITTEGGDELTTEAADPILLEA